MHVTLTHRHLKSIVVHELERDEEGFLTNSNLVEFICYCVVICTSVLGLILHSLSPSSDPC